MAGKKESKRPTKKKVQPKKAPKESLPVPHRKAGAQYLLTPEQVADAIQESKGWLNDAAEALGVTEGTLYNYRKRFPELNEVFKQAKRDRALDAQGQLHKLAKNCKDPNVVARVLMFYLKQQGKMIGYGPENKIDPKGLPGGNGGGNVIVLTPAERTEAVKRLLGWNGQSAGTPDVIDSGKSDALPVRSRKVDGGEDEGGPLAEGSSPEPI